MSGHESTTPNLSVSDWGYGVLLFSLANVLDGQPALELENSCVQVLFEGNWVTADYFFYSPFDLSSVYATFNALDSLYGLPWRLIDPMSSWTIEGNPLYPQSGIVDSMALMTKEMSAKIAAKRVLTESLRRR